MVSKEEVERLMLRYFPSCPLCGASTGYEVSGVFKTYVQCRSCGAKWYSNDFIGGKEINTLELRQADKEGRSKFLRAMKERPVSFWQSLDLKREHFGVDLERERIEEEIEILVRKAGIKDPKVARTLEEALKTGKTIDPLIETLKNDEDANKRAGAAQLLLVKDPRVIKALIQALNDMAPTHKERSKWGTTTITYGTRVQEFAAETLEKLGWKPKDDTEKAYYLFAKEKWGELERLGEPAIEPLIDGLHEFREARKTLTKIGEPAVDRLIKTLKDKVNDRRKHAAKVLGDIGDARAIEPLIEALKDEDRYVREMVAHALGDIGDARALEALTQAKKDKSWYVRSAAKNSIKKLQKK